MAQRTGATPSNDTTPPALSAPASSTPTPPFGAPSLGQPDRIWFPIHAERAFGEGPAARVLAGGGQ